VVSLQTVKATTNKYVLKGTKACNRY